MTGIHEAKIKKLDAQPQVSQFSKMQTNYFQKSFPSKSRVVNKGRWWCQIDVMFLSACHFGQTSCTQEDLPSQCLVDSHCQVSAGLCWVEEQARVSIQELALYLGHLGRRHLICASNLFILPLQVFYCPFWRTTTTTAQLPVRHDGQTDKKGLFDDPGGLWLMACPRQWW